MAEVASGGPWGAVAWASGWLERGVVLKPLVASQIRSRVPSWLLWAH